MPRYREEDRWIVGRIPVSTLNWNRRCSRCRVQLLNCENKRDGFCCGKDGIYALNYRPLPDLPSEYTIMMLHPHVSRDSRILNLLFSFASLETTMEFPQLGGPPGFLAVQGKIYHRIRPSHQYSAVRWILYDGFLANAVPQRNQLNAVPPPSVEAIRCALERVNPFIHQLLLLSSYTEDMPSAYLEIHETNVTPEIAAIIRLDNTSINESQPRRLIISKTNSETSHISTVSPLWEPLAYPLFFPHGTLGWGANQGQLAPLNTNNNN